MPSDRHVPVGMSPADREAFRRLRADARVDQASLDEKVALIQHRFEDDDPQRAADVACELRVGAMLLAGAGLERLAFGERPDIRVVVAGVPAGFEVRRARPRTEDEEDDARLREAGERGELVEYGGDAGAYQEYLEGEVLKKCRGYPDAPDQVLALVSDSRHHVDDQVLQCVADVERPTAEGRFPFAAVFWWCTRWCPGKDWVPRDAARLSPHVTAYLDSLADRPPWRRGRTG